MQFCDPETPFACVLKVHDWQLWANDEPGYFHNAPVFIQRLETGEPHALAAMLSWAVGVRAGCGMMADHAQAAVNAKGLPHAGGRWLSD